VKDCLFVHVFLGPATPMKAPNQPQ
jgi:hypothetical protein